MRRKGNVTKFDQKDIEIFKALFDHGPKLATIARSLGIPLATAGYRYNKLLEDGLNVRPNINWEVAGYASFYLKGEPQKVDNFRKNSYKRITAEEYHEVLNGRLNVCYFFVMPEDTKPEDAEPEDFDIDGHIIKTSTPYLFPPKFDWFDWNLWPKDLESLETTRLETTASDIDERRKISKNHAPRTIDDLDKKIISKLYETHRFSKISRLTNIPIETVKYRFNRRIKDLISGYEVLYPGITDTNYILELEFQKSDYPEKFLDFCENLPFVSKAHRFEEAGLILQGNLTPEEKYEFLKRINKWREQNVLSEYVYNDILPFSWRIYNILI